MDIIMPMIDAVSACALEQGLDAKVANELGIAMEEALTNVLNHGYPEKPGNVKVTCALGPDKKFFVEVEDSGIPFDPLTVAEPDVTLDIAERPIGGLGIFLMKKLMADLRYRREGGRNVLTLVPPG